MQSRVLWSPDSNAKRNSNIGQFMQWLKDKYALDFSDYQSLHQWSVDHINLFWEAISEYFKVIHHSEYQAVLSDDPMPYTKWFEGSTVNYAEHIFRNATSERPAILFQSETVPLNSISWQQLSRDTAALQSWLQQHGVQKGDRVAAYLPNIPEASISMLATIAMGVIWTSCSPDFGADSVIDRLKQIEPKILIAVDGYSYNGKVFNRKEEVLTIKAALPTVEKVILIPYIGATDEWGGIQGVLEWKEVMASPAANLHFEPVPFRHPIWILYSSGTTGAPKAITHSHGGVLLEHLKYLGFHNNVKPGENFFWFTTTGWMMWNYLHGALLMGASIVLYDGSPGYPDLNVLWKLAEQLPIQHFGTSAPFIMACKKAGIRPGEQFDFKNLQSLSSTGSPLPAEGFDYVYENIKTDLWLCSMSGGTDVCTAFVGGCPLLPVIEGEIQCRALGCDLQAYNDHGQAIMDEVGEMVIRQPMPSMPVFFWNDPGHEKYSSSYFELFPQVWSHGDWVKITRQGGVIIQGRSDATLNRQGVRIGTAEIYRAVDKLPEIKDSLIVNIELPGGGDYMPLFVVLKEGEVLTDTIRQAIKNVLRKEYSPRHVPDEIIEVKDIPYTISGKKMELPVKKILMGKAVLNLGAVKNPEALEFFRNISIERKVYSSE